MTRTLVGLLCLAAVAPLWADSPSEELVEEIAELRRQVGKDGEVVADQRDFVEALRGVAERPSDASPPSFGLPPLGGPVDVAQHGPGAPRPAMNPFGDPYSTRVGWPEAPRPAPHEPPPRSPKRLLRDSAFELDRIAHGLEMAELYGEADRLREAAQQLREKARQLGLPAQRREADRPRERFRDSRSPRAPRRERPANPPADPPPAGV